VNVVGAPNAGKSTLINALAGANICPHSRKVHTTRKNSMGVVTKDETQIVFLDTPGLIDRSDQKKFKLEEPLYQDPYDSCLDTDLIVVVHDVSNRFVREAISKRVLDVLMRNPDKPAVLVLNKMDTIPHSGRVYDLIRKLTCGQLEGKKQVLKFKAGPQKPDPLDVYFKKREKRAQKLESENTYEGDETNKQPQKLVVRSYDDILRLLREEVSGYNLDELIHNLCLGLPGWPGFRDVFTISALNGEGVDDLKDYMSFHAKPGSWKYHENLQTDEDPRALVLAICKSKFLDVYDRSLPYQVKPEIQTWQVENGVLRLFIMVHSDKPYETNQLLRNQNPRSSLFAVNQLLEQDLQNLFKCEVFVTIQVNVKHKKGPVVEPLTPLQDQLYNSMRTPSINEKLYPKRKPPPT